MVKVDQATCIGCNVCADICSSVFEMKEDKAYVKEGQENSDDPGVKTSIDICPSKSIS